MLYCRIDVYLCNTHLGIFHIACAKIGPRVHGINEAELRALNIIFAFSGEKTKLFFSGVDGKSFNVPKIGVPSNTLITRPSNDVAYNDPLT